MDCNRGGKSLSTRVSSLDAYEVGASSLEVGRHGMGTGKDGTACDMADVGKAVGERGAMGVNAPEGGAVTVKGLSACGDETQALATAASELGAGEGDVVRSNNTYEEG